MPTPKKPVAAAAPRDAFYVEERSLFVFESDDIVECLRFSRTLDCTAKVRRRSDGVLMAYRAKDSLSTAELEAEDEANQPGVPRKHAKAAAVARAKERSEECVA